jgi:diadenosine tetraphosphatase ApaH/serine/threonine PP2A family protein phosphatase
MRLGIFSDVHGNLEALTAVLQRYSQAGIERYYCLGDTVGYGGSPNECCDLVRHLVAGCVLGNHDAAVAGRMEYEYYYDAARLALDKHSQMLSEVNLAWLKTLPYQLAMPELDLALCHGTPVRAEAFDYIFAPEQAQECLSIYPRLPSLTVIGHSHLCKVFRLSAHHVDELPPIDFVLEPGYKYIVSDGSVGQPRDYDSRASYTIYDSEAKLFEFHRVSYDIDSAARKILAASLDKNFAQRLFMGV